MEHRSSGNQVIREFLELVETQLRGMWRYRWSAVLVMWLACIAGSLAVYSLPNEYKADARIYVDTQNAIRPLIQGIATSSDVMSEVVVVTRELLSRPILENVARTTELGLRAKNQQEFESLIRSLQETIRVRGSAENIYTISFQDTERNIAVSVVDSLVKTFVEKSLKADRRESSQAQMFLRSQIGEYESRLTEAEDRLADFKRENVAFMPGQQGDYYSRLQAVKNLLGAARAKFQLAQERREELIRQLEGDPPSDMTLPNNGSDSLLQTAARIRQLELQLDELRLLYTDKHPQIGQIIESIEVLRLQQQDEIRTMSARNDKYVALPSSAAARDLSPVYQNMRIQLTNTEVEVASLRTEMGQHERKIVELENSVDTVPRVEAELNRLNRDYGVVKMKYEQLLQQLERANIGEDFEASIDDVQFRIVEPPYSAIDPVGPKRQLFLAIVMVGAIGIAGALSFVLNQINSVIFTGREISQNFGIPVLGNVSKFWAPGNEAKNYGLLFVSFTLLISFSLVIMFSEPWSLVFRELAGI